MSLQSLFLFPFCTQCSAIKAQDIWVKSNGEIAKTTQKLETCARCHLARYCSRECQSRHWSTHKVGCVASEKVIAPSQVDEIVENVCEKHSGKVILCLDSEKKVLFIRKFPEEMKEGTLYVDVKIEEREVGLYTYLLCSKGFDWRSELNAILNPPNGIHNPGAQVELGHKMIEKFLYREAFQMMAERTPKHYSFLQDMFFPKAIKLMHSQKIDIEEMVSCAKLLKKNRVEVEVIIQAPSKVELPKDLQVQIESAKKLSYGARDIRMAELAQKVVTLGFYDTAFELVFNWVAFSSAKITFFRFAASEMISKKIPYEKLVQLAKSINLSESQILTETVGIYALSNRTYACQLAQQSNKSDYYLEIVFSALLNKGKKEEAKEILKLVSPAKKQDLEFFLK